MTTVGKISVKIDAETRSLDQGLDKSKRKLKETSEEFKQLSMAAKLAATAGIALVAREMVQLTDISQNLTNKLKQSTNSNAELESSFNKLFETAQRSRASLESTVELYAKMERSTRDLGISQDDLVGITETINKSFSLSGASAQEASGSIRQLGQALASGVLRGDEFNSIAEQAPLILEAVAKQTGKTAGQLRKLAADGEITSQLLINSLKAYADTIDSEFAKATATYSQQLERARNNAIKFVNENDTITNSVSALGGAIEFLSENLDVLVDGALIVGVAVLGKYAGAAATATANQIALNVAAAKSTNAFGQVVAGSRAASISMTAMASASRVASTAMAALGGPVGILITVASSLLLLGTRSDETSDKIENVGRSARNATDDLMSFNFEVAKLSRLEVSPEAIIKIEKELALAERNLAKFTKTFEATQRKFAEGKTDVRILEGAKRQVEETTAQVEALRQKLQAAQADLRSLTGQEDPEKKKEKDAQGQDAAALEIERELQRQVRMEELRMQEFNRKKAFAQEELMWLQESFMTREQLLLGQYDKELAMFRQMEQDKLITAQEFADAKTQIEEARARAEMDITVGSFKSIFQSLGKHNKGMLKMAKAFGLAEAGISIARGIAKAQELGFPANLAEMARVIAVGSQVFSQIRGAKAGAASVGAGGGGAAPAAAPPPQQPGAGGPGRVFNIDMTGSSSMSTQQARNLLELINEQAGDNVEINLRGG